MSNVQHIKCDTVSCKMITSVRFGGSPPWIHLHQPRSSSMNMDVDLDFCCWVCLYNHIATDLGYRDHVTCTGGSVEP